MNEETNRWAAKTEVYRNTLDFTDLLKIVACYYEMYSKAVNYVGPYISKQHGASMFIPPDREQLKAALGKERPQVSFRARSAFVDAALKFISVNKGKKALLHPTPSSHHSAQFPDGTFTITEVVNSDLRLRDDKGARKPVSRLWRIEFAGSEAPVFVEDLRLDPTKIKFIILRPKLGKLGTASTSRWEVLLYTKPHGYLIEHVDSDLNPRWSGIL
jgi:hypothetical protein